MESTKSQCGICAKRFFNNFNLRSHLKQMHETNELVRLKCELCDNTFGSRGSLKSHFNSNHSRSTENQCNICDKYLDTKSHLKRHIDSVHKVLEGSISCDKCNKSFTSTDNLRKHIDVVHKNIKKYSCKDCSQEFSYYASFKSHRVLQHEAEPSKCQLCEKTFTSKRQLKKHDSIVHEFKEKKTIKVKCNICKKNFLSKITLDQHVKVVHNDKVHKCETCDKTFTFRALINHQRNVHQKKDKKPVLCIICNKILSTNDKLKRHIKTVHDTLSQIGQFAIFVEITYHQVNL